MNTSYEIRPVTIDKDGNVERAADPTAPNVYWAVYHLDYDQESMMVLPTWLADFGKLGYAEDFVNREGLMEVAVDIAFDLGCAQRKLAADDSRQNVSDIIKAAERFESENAHIDWGLDADYLECIENFITELKADSYPV